MKLVPITSENWRNAIFLTTDAERVNPLDQKWLASNAFSLLQAHYDTDWDCRIIMNGEEAVGFAFYGYWRERDIYLLCRYMIDERFQGKGYGKQALPLVVEQIRRQYGCRDVYVSVSEENTIACKLYSTYGFKKTDMRDEEEFVYVLEG